MVLIAYAGNAGTGAESSETEEKVQSAEQSEPLEKSELPADSDEAEGNTDKDDSFIKEESHLTPVRVQWEEGDMDYDPEDRIYYKTYYDDFIRGKQAT